MVDMLCSIGRVGRSLLYIWSCIQLKPLLEATVTMSLHFSECQKGNIMSEALSREIQKLDVRLERFITKEDDFIKSLRQSISQFRLLHQQIEQANQKPGVDMSEDLGNSRLVAIETFSDALTKASDAEHEKSHLLESYGALILAIEKACE